MKGLCPFHDEKTPSFHVRPHVNRWHCFGCGEGGDAISFIERIEHVSFVEAIELLARKAGVTIEYEESQHGGRDENRPRDVTRSRLIDAHRVAEEFYIQQLATEAGKPARDMLAARGFSPQTIADFRIGYSPDSWDGVLTELRRRGFTDKEILASGLATQKHVASTIGSAVASCGQSAQSQVTLSDSAPVNFLIRTKGRNISIHQRP